MRSLLVGAAVVAAMLLGASSHQYIPRDGCHLFWCDPLACPYFACQEMPQLR